MMSGKANTSLVVWWGIITALYLAFNVPLFLSNSSSQLLQIISSFLGMFVPVGWYYFLILVQNLGLAIIVLVLILLGIFGGDYLLKKMHLSEGKELLMDIVILFVLTMVVDMIMVHKLFSVGIFIQSFTRS